MVRWRNVNRNHFTFTNCIVSDITRRLSFATNSFGIGCLVLSLFFFSYVAFCWYHCLVLFHRPSFAVWNFNSFCLSYLFIYIQAHTCTFILCCCCCFFLFVCLLKSVRLSYRWLACNYLPRAEVNAS